MTSVTSSVSLTPFSTMPSRDIPPPVFKSAEYSVSQIALAFFKEKIKDLTKAASYLVFWSTEAVPSLPSNVTQFRSLMGQFKNFISVTELPDKLYALRGSVKELIAGIVGGPSKKVAEIARKAFKDGMGLINTAADTIEFANIFTPMISKETLKCVSGVNFAATAASAGIGALEQIQNIQKIDTIDSKRTTFYLLNLARDVSYLALGGVGLFFMFTGAPVIPWVIVACATSGLVVSITNYFYEKIVDPENKGKNLNPAIVVENYRNQTNYEQRLATITA